MLYWMRSRTLSTTPPHNAYAFGSIAFQHAVVQSNGLKASSPTYRTSHSRPSPLQFLAPTRSHTIWPRSWRISGTLGCSNLVDLVSLLSLSTTAYAQTWNNLRLHQHYVHASLLTLRSLTTFHRYQPTRNGLPSSSSSTSLRAPLASTGNRLTGYTTYTTTPSTALHCY